VTESALQHFREVEEQQAAEREAAEAPAVTPPAPSQDNYVPPASSEDNYTPPIQEFREVEEKQAAEREAAEEVAVSEPTPSVSERAEEIAEETGMPYSAVVSSVEAHPEEYGVSVAVEEPEVPSKVVSVSERAEEIAEETGMPYSAVVSSVEKHPEEYGVPISVGEPEVPEVPKTYSPEDVEARAKEIADETGMAYSAVVSSVKAHPEEYDVPTSFLFPEIVEKPKPPNIEKALAALDPFVTWGDTPSVDVYGAVMVGQDEALKMIGVTEDVIEEAHKALDSVRKETPALYNVLTTQGFDAYLAASKKLQSDYGEALSAMKDYEVKDAKARAAEIAEETGMPYSDVLSSVEKHPEEYGASAFEIEGGIGYDLVAAVDAGVPEKYLDLLFGKEKVNEVIRETAVPGYSIIPTPEGLKDFYPESIPTTIPSGLPSDEEYAKLSNKEKLALAKKGDIRPLYVGISTWAEACEKALGQTGWQKPLELAQTPVFYGLDPVYQDIQARLAADPGNSKIQKEKDAYMARWQRGGYTTAAIISSFFLPQIWGAIGSVGATGISAASKVVPAFIQSVPVLSSIPRAAISIAQFVAVSTPVVYTGATFAEVVQTANLERKWVKFQTLPEGAQDFWAKQAGYDDFQSLTESQKANVLLRYSVPPGYTSEQWSGVLAGRTDSLIRYAEKGSEWLQEHSPSAGGVPVTAPLIIGGGAVVGALVEASSYMAQIPLLSVSLLDKTPEGTADEYAVMLAKGMAAFFTTVLPAAFKADPYFTSGRVVGLFMLSPGMLGKLAKANFAKLRPSYIPERAMAMEYNTIRVNFTETQLAHILRLSDVAKMRLGDEIVATLLRGETFVKDFGTIKLEVENVPYQQVLGNKLFHFTPDINAFEGSIAIADKLYLSPQAAVRAGIRSLVKGEVAAHPGLVEVAMPEGFRTQIEKLLGRGEVEIEAPLKGYVLDPIPGWKGKGVSSNTYFGSYPIRRFTLRGVDYPGTKINWEGVLTKVGDAKDVVIDLDLTLVDGRGKLFPGAKNFLLKLKSQGKSITLWTHSTEARTNAILSREGIARIFDRIITREKYEPTGSSPDALKDIRKIGGDILIDNSGIQARRYAELGLEGKVITPKADVPIAELTPAKLVEIRVRAFTSSVADAFMGWHGRMEAIKRQVAANKKLKQTLDNIDAGLKSLKEGEVEVIGEHGEIVRQRQPFPHPTRSGSIKPRVTTIVRNSKGEIMLVMDRAEASYGLPGGQIDINYKPGMLGFKRLPDGRHVLTPEGAAHGQVKSETGVGLEKTRLLDTYSGKVNEHAMSGSRVYEALAKTDRIDESLLGRGQELTDAFWWDGKSEITVYPATFDILRAVAKKYGLDMSKVEIDTTRPVLNRTRDIAFADRVVKGEKLTPGEIRSVNSIEIKNLKTLRRELTVPGFSDWVKGEAGFDLLHELIAGRRRASKWSPTEEPVKFVRGLREDMAGLIELIREIPEDVFRSDFGMLKREVLSKLERSLREVETLKDASDIRKRAAEYAKTKSDLINSRLAKEDIRAYLDRGDVLTNHYVSYFDKAIRAAVGATAPRRAFTAPRKSERFIPRRVIPERFIVPRVVEVRYPEHPNYPPTYTPPTPLYTPPYTPPPPPPYTSTPPPPPPPPLPLLPSGTSGGTRPKIPAGSIAWRQGMLKVGEELRPVWKYIPPPFDQPKPITLLAPPAGADRVEMRTPRETIQMIGEPSGPVPEHISIDLGVADVYVTDFGRNIKYTGKGLETIVGKRIMVPEKGMSIPTKVDSGVEEVKEMEPKGLGGLKLGSSFAEFIRRTPENAAQREFMEERITEYMSEMTPEEIADEIKSAGLTEPKYELPEGAKGKGKGKDVNAARVRELLSHLPDRTKVEVKRLLRERKYVKVGKGHKYAEVMPSWRRSSPSKVREFTEKELGFEKERIAKKLKRKGSFSHKEVRPAVSEVLKV